MTLSSIVLNGLASLASSDIVYDSVEAGTGKCVNLLINSDCNCLFVFFLSVPVFEVSCRHRKLV